MKDFLVSEYITELFNTGEGHSMWFGYYNYDTLDGKQSRLLCNLAGKDGRAPVKGDEITVGYFSLKDKVWHPVGVSDSWNWQQGCMAQWLPGSRVVYNFSDGKGIRSKIVDTTTGEEKILPHPVYGITPDGRTSITLEMERSYWCRAYHYESVANKEMDVNILKGDGIFSMDLESGERTLIVPIEKIIAIDPRPDFENMKHWAEHVMINQSGTKFCFLHRFSPAYDVNLYQTRLFVANIDGSGLQLIADWDKYDLSHFGWNGDEFAIYSVENNQVAATYKSLGQSSSGSKTTVMQIAFKTLARLARMLPAGVRKKLKGGKSYYSYYKPDEHGVYRKAFSIGGGYMKIDGHPSFSNDGRYMVTDTYPDSHGFQHLLVYDLHTGQSLELAKFRAFYHGTPASCDLHPKVCRDNNFIAVDTAYNRHHHLLLFRMEWDKIKERISQ